MKKNYSMKINLEGNVFEIKNSIDLSSGKCFTITILIIDCVHKCYSNMNKE